MYGLYLHIPFCVSICNYCDYFVDKRLNLRKRYVAALTKEIETFGKELKDKPKINTIYIGGGTPSVLEPSLLETIISTISKYFDLSQLYEFTMESNPDTADLETLKAYKNAGVDRLSVGVQTFDRKELGYLKRNHSPKKAVEFIESAKNAGFENISLDLIFSIPGQTLASFEESLETALKLGINHISTYSLIYEPGTPLFKKWEMGKIEKQSDQADAEFYEFAIDYLNLRGFYQYEVSNFSPKGYECQHNLHTWNGGEYFAFGASAHGYYQGSRFNKISHLDNYMKLLESDLSVLNNIESISENDSIFENLYLPIRANGIDCQRFENIFGYDLLRILAKFIEEYLAKGMIVVCENRLKLTKMGYMLCDTVTLALICEFERKTGLKFNS